MCVVYIGTGRTHAVTDHDQVLENWGLSFGSAMEKWVFKAN